MNEQVVGADEGGAFVAVPKELGAHHQDTAFKLHQGNGADAGVSDATNAIHPCGYATIDPVFRRFAHFRDGVGIKQVFQDPSPLRYLTTRSLISSSISATSGDGQLVKVSSRLLPLVGCGSA